MSNKVFCNCLKCQQNDVELGIGLLIPKSTRTRHRKSNYKQPKQSEISSLSSSPSSSSSILISGSVNNSNMLVTTNIQRSSDNLDSNFNEENMITEDGETLTINFIQLPTDNNVSIITDIDQLSTDEEG